MGFVLPGFSEDINDIIERIGLDHAKQLWALSEQGLEYVRRTILGTQMPGVDLINGWLHVSKTDNTGDLHAEVERMRWIGADVEFWPAARVREQLPSPHYFDAVHYRQAFHIDPYNYALGLAALAEKAGARIFEETPAISLDPAGVRKRIVTPAGRVRAAQVVLAGNIHLGTLMPQLAATLLPVTTFVMVTQPIGEILHEVVRYHGAVSDTNRADNHYRIVGGDRLQWSGRMRAWEANPRFVGRGLVNDVRRTFPDLGTVEIAHLWRGTLGRTVHRMPQIGEIERGVWLASVVDGDQSWQLFAPYELVWAGGVVGRMLAQGIYWGTRPIERIEQGIARYRAEARARKYARLAQKDSVAAE
jgi:glycine/D-amino acid oxidase-like deaminating enzyme